MPGTQSDINKKIEKQSFYLHPKISYVKPKVPLLFSFFKILTPLSHTLTHTQTHTYKHILFDAVTKCRIEESLMYSCMPSLLSPVDLPTPPHPVFYKLGRKSGMPKH